MADESDVDIEMDGDAEKDETEMELERLVFGDSIAFRQGLKGFALEDDEEGSEEEVPETSGLEGLDDAEVGQVSPDVGSGKEY